jgi:hypothetical protein
MSRAAALTPPRPVKAHFVATRIDRQLQVDVSVTHRLAIARAGITGAACGALVGLIVGAFATPPIVAALGGAAVGALIGAALFCLVGYCAATGLTLGWYSLQQQRTQACVHRRMDAWARSLKNSSVEKLSDFIDSFRTDATREEFADTTALRDLYKRFLNELEVEKKNIIEEQKTKRAKSTQDSQVLARRAATEAFSHCLAISPGQDRSKIVSELRACARYFPEKSIWAQELNYLASETSSVHEAVKLIAAFESHLILNHKDKDRSTAITKIKEAMEAMPQLEQTYSGPTLLYKYITHLEGPAPTSRFPSSSTLAIIKYSDLKSNLPSAKKF